jgi:CubicO group peptidase (beta-lactamase class C family)
MTGKMDEVLQSGVARGDVPGVVALAAGDDGLLYEGAAGKRAADVDDPITPDTMLRIASMTKMVTTTAALQLSERASLDLDAPVDTYRPEFADLQVLENPLGQVLQKPARAHQTHPLGVGPGQQLSRQLLSGNLLRRHRTRIRRHHHRRINNLGHVLSFPPSWARLL